MSPAGSATAAAAPPRHLAADEDLLRACVHCGFCLPACPTYDVLGDENDSPRGRLHLMGALLEGRTEAGGAFATHIGQCLGCRACEPVCPAGVEYGALLESARADGVERRRAPLPRLAHLAGRLALGLLTGAAGRILFPILRWLRASRLPRLAGNLPGRVGLAARLLEATRPDPALHRRGDRAAADRIRSESSEAEDARRASAAAHPSTEPVATDSAGYALLEGCVMHGLFGHVHRATRVALTAAGLREVAAPGQGCCGALHAHAGFAAAASERARRNVEAFEAAGAGRIVVNSAGCGAAMREYPRWLADDPAWSERAGRVADRVRDVSEVLVDGPGSADGPAERLPGTADGTAERPSVGEATRGPAGGRIGYDAPCHLLYGQGVRDAPLQLLATIPGADIEALPSRDRCCGGAGIYNLLHPDLAERVLAPKLEEVASAGLARVATGNPGCIMQIGAGLQAAGSAARAVHPVELVAAAATPRP